MSIETYQFNLPITPGAIPPVLHLSQYDSGRTFTAVLRDDANVPFELDSGATAVIKGRNAAGIAWQQDCTVSGANVTFTPSGAATDQFGVMPVTIEITESEEIISPLCVVFHIQKAGYTNEEAVLSPDFETAIQAAVAQAIAEGGLGFSDEFKEALLACFEQVSWKTTYGQTYLSALETALYPGVYLASITAAYDQDRPIYTDDSLDLVRLDLVVTATYSDGTSETLADDAYELTGTLTAGTSTITVSYGGKTASVSVLVTAPLYSIADFAEQTVTVSGKTLSVKKENGVFTMSGIADGVVYIYPNGTANSTKSNTLWFSTLQDKPFVNRALDVQYANTGSVALTFSTKLGQSDNTGNLASTSLSIAANSSGSEAVVEFSNNAYNARNMSCLALQISGNRSYSATVSFKVRMFCDGVRYL